MNSVEDVDPDFIRQARAVVATGTHLSHSQVEAATLKALTIAREAKLKTALDIDYRPNLWGVAGHGDGESRFVVSQKVTEKLQSTLHLFDLIVGTEEEFHIAGGSTDTITALHAVRAVTAATLVCKRGAQGAVVFENKIGGSLEEGQASLGVAIEVFNVLGAGDGFMSGLLKGWLDGEDWSTALKYANASGALAVSRHGCTPAYPSWEELQFFFDYQIKRPDLRNDALLEQVHWATNRHLDWPELKIFAFDHRSQMEKMEGATVERIGKFKTLCLQAAKQVAAGRVGFGILCDSRLGQDALFQTADTDLWVGRPAEWPGSRPLEVEPELGTDFGGLAEWPRDQVVKVLCFCHPDDGDNLWQGQIQTVRGLFKACRRNRLEFLLELIPSKAGPVDENTTASVIQRFYDEGIFPDWWKLEPLLSATAWQKTIDAIERNDGHTRGIVVLGLGESEDMLEESFRVAAKYPLVKGFAVGRTIFADVAQQWFLGKKTDSRAIKEIEKNYGKLCRIWDKARTA